MLFTSIGQLVSHWLNFWQHSFLLCFGGMISLAGIQLQMHKRKVCWVILSILYTWIALSKIQTITSVALSIRFSPLPPGKHILICHIKN